MNGKDWTHLENKYLLRYYSCTPNDEICAFLERSLSSVYGRAKELGLQKDPECDTQPKQKVSKKREIKPSKIIVDPARFYKFLNSLKDEQRKNN